MGTPRTFNPCWTGGNKGSPRHTTAPLARAAWVKTSMPLGSVLPLFHTCVFPWSKCIRAWDHNSTSTATCAPSGYDLLRPVYLGPGLLRPTGFPCLLRPVPLRPGQLKPVLFRPGLLRPVLLRTCRPDPVLLSVIIMAIVISTRPGLFGPGHFGIIAIVLIIIIIIIIILITIAIVIDIVFLLPQFRYESSYHFLAFPWCSLFFIVFPLFFCYSFLLFFFSMLFFFSFFICFSFLLPLFVFFIFSTRPPQNRPSSGPLHPSEPPPFEAHPSEL